MSSRPTRSKVSCGRIASERARWAKQSRATPGQLTAVQPCMAPSVSMARTCSAAASDDSTTASVAANSSWNIASSWKKLQQNRYSLVAVSMSSLLTLRKTACAAAHQALQVMGTHEGDEGGTGAGAAHLDRRLAALCLHHMRDERGLVQVVQDRPAVPERKRIVPRGLSAAPGARKQIGDHAAHAAGRRLANHIRRARHVLLRTRT